MLEDALGYPVVVRHGDKIVLDPPTGIWPDLSWTCHVCGNDRPDAQISVFSKTADDKGMYLDVVVDAQMTVNVRYCNDKDECKSGAEAVAESWLAIHLKNKGGDDGPS